MTSEVMARLLCAGCDAELTVPIGTIRIEKRRAHYECPSCGPRVRSIKDKEWEALADAFDYPGGTMISEREVDDFVRCLKYVHRFVEELHD